MHSYKILQLTDTHLFDSDEYSMYGVKTNKNFADTLKFIKGKDFNFNAIFLTGDISQDKTPKSYIMIAEMLSFFNKTIYWIPGNHDDFTIMAEVFSKYELFKQGRSFFIGKINWHFIFCDSTFPNKDSGFLRDNAIEELSRSLSNANASSCVSMIMHHHPIKVGVSLIDKYILENADIFWEQITQSKKQVKIVICGHVHGDYDLENNGIRVISCPATSLQFRKGTSKSDVDNVPGFKLWKFSLKGNFSYETYFIR